jgi:hypothetical protein
MSGPGVQRSGLKKYRQLVSIKENRIHSFEVSHERCRWPRAASLIEKETFGARFRNWPLLGFAIRNNTGKM